MLRLVKGLKTYSKEVEDGRCMEVMESRFSEKKRGKVCKDYMERIMDEENDWDHNVEGDAVEGKDRRNNRKRNNNNRIIGKVRTYSLCK